MLFRSLRINERREVQRLRERPHRGDGAVGVGGQLEVLRLSERLEGLVGAAQVAEDAELGAARDGIAEGLNDPEVAVALGRDDLKARHVLYILSCRLARTGHASTVVMLCHSASMRSRSNTAWTSWLYILLPASLTQPGARGETAPLAPYIPLIQPLSRKTHARGMNLRGSSFLVRIARAMLGAVFVGACGGASAEGPDVVRSDSAGVRIVTSGAVDRELPWRFDSVGVLTDSLGEPWRFTGLARHHVLADRLGRLYIVLTRERALVRFNADGRFDRTIGRQGGGPGEFQFPLAITAHGDTLVVRDGGKGALVRFSSSLDAVPDRRLEGALAHAGMIEFRAGGLWFSEAILDDSGQGIALRADTLGGAPLHRVMVKHGGPVQFDCVGVPRSRPLFSPGLTWAASGPRIIVNPQPSYALWLHEGPRVVASVRRPIASRAPTVADVRDLYPDGLVLGVGGARKDCRVTDEALIEKQGLADDMPFVDDVQLFSDGTIWARRSLRTAKMSVVDVFRSDGAYAGTVRGMQLPVARQPSGELLVLRDDAESGGAILIRMRVIR